MADKKYDPKPLIDAAWQEYRRKSMAIPLSLPYSGHRRNGVYRDGFLETDDRFWEAYKRAEWDALHPKAQAA